MSGIVFDFPHPSKGEVGRNRRTWNTLKESRQTLVGAESAIRASVAKYGKAAKADPDVSPADAASAPLLAVEVVDQVTGLLDVVDREIHEAHAHQQSAVHSMQRQERRADRADDILGRLVEAFLTTDESAMERAIIAAITHRHDPDLQERAVHDAALAAVADAAAYRPKPRALAVTA